jgi:hypothetical protein
MILVHRIDRDGYALLAGCMLLVLFNRNSLVSSILSHEPAHFLIDIWRAKA